MTRYDLNIRLRLPENAADPEMHLDALFEAGLDDAVPGVANKGYLALAVSREAKSAEEAVSSALQQVSKAIPNAVVLEVGPDLVTLADAAELLHTTRQNLSKHMRGEVRRSQQNFPAPRGSGTSPLWHLSDITEYFRNTEHELPLPVEELALCTRRANFLVERNILAKMASDPA